MCSNIANCTRTPEDNWCQTVKKNSKDDSRKKEQISTISTPVPDNCRPIVNQTANKNQTAVNFPKAQKLQNLPIHQQVSELLELDVATTGISGDFLACMLSVI